VWRGGEAKQASQLRLAYKLLLISLNVDVTISPLDSQMFPTISHQQGSAS
jgi:hypothetical protein